MCVHCQGYFQLTDSIRVSFRRHFDRQTKQSKGRTRRGSCAVDIRSNIQELVLFLATAVHSLCVDMSGWEALTVVLLLFFFQRQTLLQKFINGWSWIKGICLDFFKMVVLLNCYLKLLYSSALLFPPRCWIWSPVTISMCHLKRRCTEPCWAGLNMI